MTGEIGSYLSMVDRSGRVKRAANGLSVSKGKPGVTFAEVLNGAALPVQTEAQARTEQIAKTAGDLVAHALILPMLKQVRRGSETGNPVFNGGMGEKTFGPEFDMTLAERIAHSPNLPVKDALVKRLSVKA